MSRPFQNLQFKREINGPELNLYLEAEKANNRDIFILHNRGWSSAGLAECFVMCIPCIERIIARVEEYGYTDDTVILESSSDSDSE